MTKKWGINLLHRGTNRHFSSKAAATAKKGVLKKKFLEVRKSSTSFSATAAQSSLLVNGRKADGGFARNNSAVIKRGVQRSDDGRSEAFKSVFSQRTSDHHSYKNYAGRYLVNKKHSAEERGLASDAAEAGFISSRIKRYNPNELTVGLNLGQKGIPRRRRFYFQRKSLKEWRDFSNILPNFSNKPFYLKSNWDNRKV
jgi:hypothetical protein